MDYCRNSITPLDDSFGILLNQKHKHSNRLVEFNYSIFGDTNALQQKLINSIPSNLQMIAIDLQFTEDTGFLLTRSGEIYYAGKGTTFFLTDSDAWIDLNISEHIIQMHLDPYANCLLLRSGAGHLWIIGNSIGSLDSQIPHGNNSKKFKKLRIPHRKKGTSISGIPGALGYVTDNGKCYLFGRHIASSNNDNGQMTGFDGFSVASLGVGKTHIVAISKTGLVYTCGLNNLNQCGRDEVSKFFCILFLIHAAAQKIKI
uniref:Uncharacterized protein n=1 Tax=Panagrolaimus superbus TaxID=310955 RepID=A0A914YB63_9BILA